MTAPRAGIPSPVERTKPPDRRIILVGRTGLERTLRPYGPVRVRRALDAVGELADSGARGPAATVVLVGADADPGAGRADEFVRALRRVEPGVRILRVGGEERGAYDGTVSVNDSAEAMFRIAEAPVSASLPPGPEVDHQEVDSLIGFMLDGRGDRSSPGDAELVGLMLRGRDVMPAALRLLRERTCEPGLNFVPARADGSAPSEQGVDVAWRGHRFGRIVAPSLGGEVLAPHAAWLAGWLALEAQQAQLRSEAFTDSLTGAWNRRYFERFMESALQTAQRERRHLTILVFDLDDFKKYNDLFGHAAGDSILIETVRLLKSVIRPSDRVCRIGGDEFVVIFHEPDGPRMPTSKPPESIYGIAQRFQRQVCGHKFPKLGEQAPGTLTISGGLATFPWDGRTAGELLARADELALQGKRTGKNTIVFGPGAADVCGTGEG